jgi:hypothetical protein
MAIRTVEAWIRGVYREFTDVIVVLVTGGVCHRFCQQNEKSRGAGSCVNFWAGHVRSRPHLAKQLQELYQPAAADTTNQGGVCCSALNQRSGENLNASASPTTN